jgi:hypothetical protein
MTFLSFLLLAASAAAQAPPAAESAPNWRPLGTGRGGFVVSWDSASIEREGDNVRIRLKTERPAPAPGTVAHAISRVEIRCAGALGHVVETVNYLTDGTRGRTDTEAGPLEPIPPNSMMSVIQRAVC